MGLVLILALLLLAPDGANYEKKIKEENIMLLGMGQQEYV
jgi:hypothetical protein